MGMVKNQVWIGRGARPGKARQHIWFVGPNIPCYSTAIMPRSNFTFANHVVFTGYQIRRWYFAQVSNLHGFLDIENAPMVIAMLPKTRASSVLESTGVAPSGWGWLYLTARLSAWASFDFSCTLSNRTLELLKWTSSSFQNLMLNSLSAPPERTVCDSEWFLSIILIPVHLIIESSWWIYWCELSGDGLLALRRSEVREPVMVKDQILLKHIWSGTRPYYSILFIPPSTGSTGSTSLLAFHSHPSMVNLHHRRPFSYPRFFHSYTFCENQITMLMLRKYTKVLVVDHLIETLHCACFWFGPALLLTLHLF